MIDLAPKLHPMVYDMVSRTSMTNCLGGITGASVAATPIAFFILALWQVKLFVNRAILPPVTIAHKGAELVCRYDHDMMILSPTGDHVYSAISKRGYDTVNQNNRHDHAH